MMTLFESPGVWWLPGRREQRVPGLLRVFEDGRIETHLFEALLGGPLDADAVFEELHGTLHRSPLSGGTEITQLRGFAIKRSFSSSGAASETLVANRSYVGDRHVAAAERFGVFGAELEGLVEWLPGSTISAAARVQAAAPSIDRVALVHESTLRLRKGTQVQRTRHRISFTEAASARISVSTSVAADEVVEDWLVPLRMFLTLATGKISFVKRFTIVLEEGDTWPDEIHDLAIWAAAEGRKKDEGEDAEPFIALPDQDDRLSRLLERWWTMRRTQRRAMERVFALWDRPPEYIDIRFVAYSNAIDLLARTIHGTPAAAVTLFESLPEEIPAILRGASMFELWRTVRDRLDEDGDVAGPDLLALCGALKWVVRFTWLAQLDVPLDPALRSGELRHDARRLEQVLSRRS